MPVKKYKRKESFTEAIQWTGQNDDEILKLFNRDVSIEEEKKWDDQKKELVRNKTLYLQNSHHETTEELAIGDYILIRDQTLMEGDKEEFEEAHVMVEKEGEQAIGTLSESCHEYCFYFHKWGVKSEELNKVIQRLKKLLMEEYKSSCKYCKNYMTSVHPEHHGGFKKVCSDWVLSNEYKQKLEQAVEYQEEEKK